MTGSRGRVRPTGGHPVVAGTVLMVGIVVVIVVLAVLSTW